MHRPTPDIGASAIDFEDFGYFEILGKDAEDYLHRQLSNEIRGLKPGQGVPVCYLNAQGRIRLYFDLWKTENGYKAIVVGSQRNCFLEEMERLVFREEIEFVDHTEEFSSVLILGSESHQWLRTSLGGVSLPDEIDFIEGILEKNPVFVFRRDWLRIPAFQILFPTEVANGISQQLGTKAISMMEMGEFHALRIEKGTPWPDHEVSDSMIPYECGLGDSVSLTKGCYVGQEVIARMANLGTPPRLLRGLLVEGPQGALPDKGSPVKSGDVEVGEILSAAYSRGLNRIVCTSSIRKKFAGEGTSLSVGDTPAIVRVLPL